MQNITESIIEIIKNNFPNGIRNDFIDVNKVMRIYLASREHESILRNCIADIIRENGIEFGGRFYFISDADAENILSLVNGILENHAVAYYVSICDRHADFLKQVHIFSPDVLKTFLQRSDDGHFYFDEFCSANGTARLDNMIDMIFDSTGRSLSIDDLQKRLPYVPTDITKALLDNAQQYFPTTEGKYIPVDRIKFDMDEIEEARRQITLSIDANGYAELDGFSLESNFALNPELVEKNLRAWIYDKFLADEFAKRGKRLFKKGDNSSKRGASIARLRKFIEGQEELSCDGLLAFANELGLDRPTALNNAHDIMVRADKNLFVADELIRFDIDGIDKSLAPFVQNKIIPLRAVTSFTGFPPVGGYSWNLFLLESFLRNFSRRYSYAAPAANSSNVGAIHPRSMRFSDYLDVQTAVVVQEHVSLEQSAIENFLIEQGYRKTRIGRGLDKIIDRSKDFGRH